jgi:hypothetical protein
MIYISVDVEADGPCPGLYSMVCFGAVVVDNKLDKTFYGQTAPISDKFIPSALAVSGFTRREHEKFQKPLDTIAEFREWLFALNDKRLVFITDNPAFDWQFINYYMFRFSHSNPFGWSARHIGDLYCGLQGDLRAKWTHLRDTPHTHNPVDDAKGNAEAFLKILNQIDEKNKSN